MQSRTGLKSPCGNHGCPWHATRKRATHALRLPHGQRLCRAQARVGDGRKAQRAGRLQRVRRGLGAPRPAAEKLLP